jgi:hypothetical protein
VVCRFPHPVSCSGLVCLHCSEGQFNLHTHINGAVPSGLFSANAADLYSGGECFGSTLEHGLS